MRFIYILRTWSPNFLLFYAVWESKEPQFIHLKSSVLNKKSLTNFSLLVNKIETNKIKKFKKDTKNDKCVFWGMSHAVYRIRVIKINVFIYWLWSYNLIVIRHSFLFWRQDLLKTQRRQWWYGVKCFGLIWKANIGAEMHSRAVFFENLIN